jgi:hypothetical protein
MATLEFELEINDARMLKLDVGRSSFGRRGDLRRDK